jgi:hypothetical protein
MAGLSTAAKNLMLDALGAAAVFASLHTADPGASGTSEVSGGSPAYARKAITWNAASGADLDNNANPVFDVPASTTVTHFGLWSLASGGTYYGSGLLSASEVFSGQGTYTLSDADATLT